MTRCESSANRPPTAGFPQVAIRTTPLTTALGLDRVLQACRHATRIRELEKALTLAHEIKAAAPDQQVILTVHEMKCLARNSAELMTLSAQLQSGGVQLGLLTGPLTDLYDPHGLAPRSSPYSPSPSSSTATTSGENPRRPASRRTR